MAAELTYDPKASAFDELELTLKNHLFLLIGALNFNMAVL